MYISGGNQLLDAKKLLGRIELAQNMKIADLGCGGAGHFIIPAARIVGDGGRAYAVDVMRSVLDVVTKKSRLMGIHNVKPIWANIELLGSTKIPNDSLDRVLLVNVMFQSHDRKSIMMEAKRLLRMGGVLLVIDWGQEAVPFGPPIVDRMKAGEVKSYASGLGLKLIEEFEAGKYHFGLIFQK